jgi:PAS domain S-box-containing protein
MKASRQKSASLKRIRATGRQAGRMPVEDAWKPGHERQVQRSARTRAGDALHYARQLNQQIITGAKEGIVVHGRDLKILSWNPFMERLTGKSAAQVVGRHPVEVFPYLKGVGIMEHLQKVLAGEKCLALEFHFDVPNTGRSRFVSYTTSPLRSVKGGITSSVSIIDDISERRRVEKRIVQLNRAYAILASIDHAIVHILNRQELLEEICRVAVEKGGFKLAWVGIIAPDRSVQPVAQAGTTEYLNGIRIMATAVAEGRGPVGTAIRQNRPVVIEEADEDSRTAPWHDRLRKFGLRYVAAFPIRVGDKVVGAFVVYAPQPNFFDKHELGLLTQVNDDISFALTAISDITARKQAEEALRRSEYNLANFFNQAPIGLIWLSADGTILRANQAQLDMLGYAAQDYLGHSFTEYCGEPSQGRELLERLAAKETVRNLRMTRRCKDGSIRQIMVDAVSFWSNGQHVQSSVFLRDITDRIELEAEILQTSEKESRRIAQDLHDGLGQLLAGVAHLAHTLHKNLAAKSHPEAPQSERIVKVIYEAIAQARSLSRGLHPVESVSNGLMVALETLARQTKSLFQINCRFTCRRPLLIADDAVATHLYRIAQEAVSNAIKHGKPGRIEISLTGMPEQIALVVKDDGTGIHIRQRKNSGMGLRIMQYRARIIDGSLTIKNEEGGGTAVVCTVPLSGKGAMRRHKTTRRRA